MKVKISRLFYYILLLLPFIDLLTGYALNTKSGGILAYTGPIYRIAVFFYMFYNLYGRRFPQKRLWLLLFTGYTGGLAIINTVRFNASLFENVSSTIKFLFPIYMTYCLIEAAKKNYGLIDRVLNAFSWIYPLSFIIPRLMGQGYYLVGYAFESGYKSFYFATNEQNVVLVILFVYAFQKLYEDLTYEKKSFGAIRFDIVNFIKLLLIVFALILIGTKTSIFAIVIVCLLYWVKQGGFKEKIKFFWIFVIAGFAVGTFIANVLSVQLENMAKRIIYSYHKLVVEEGGVLTFIVSKRNLRITPAIEYWYHNNSGGVFNFLFGVGKASKCPDNGIGVNPFALIELDFFDCLFWFGIIATVVVMLFYFSFFFRAVKIPELFMEKVMLCLILGFSMFAGHVMVSANSGTVFAIVMARIYLNSRTEEQQKQKMENFGWNKRYKGDVIHGNAEEVG